MQPWWRRSFFFVFVLCNLLLAGCGQNFDNLDFHVDVELGEDTATVAVEIVGIKNAAAVHAHLFLDGGPEIMMYADKYTYRNLMAGEHELVVELARDDHKPIPGQRKVITFTLPGESP